MLKGIPTVGVALADATEKCVAEPCVVPEPLPHPLRSHKLHIEIRTNSDFFIMPPHALAGLLIGLPIHSRANPRGIDHGQDLSLAGARIPKIGIVTHGPTRTLSVTLLR
jgi:hypothetical protein